MRICLKVKGETTNVEYNTFALHICRKCERQHIPCKIHMTLESFRNNVNITETISIRHNFPSRKIKEKKISLTQKCLIMSQNLHYTVSIVL